MAPMPAFFPDLDGAAVLVTGGGSGIGAAIVEGFVRQGSKVAFIDIAEAEGRRLAERLGPGSKHAPHFIPADLRDVAASRAAVEQAAAHLGSIRVLVNNAAWDDRHDLETVTEDYWDNNQAVNLRQVFFVSQAAVPHMRKAGGAIVNMSSIAFMLNMPDLPAYATAKAGIIGLTKSLAGRLGSDDIRVNAILPGMIVTERQKRLWLTDDGIESMVRERQCLKRVLTAEDIVGPCLFLASACSAGITAQSLIADGGIL